jgi:hypothetical protein
MQKLFRPILATYTAIIGILIPITLFIKASSFNKDYYPASFVLFVALLTAIFLFSIYLLFSGDRKSFSKNIIRNILIVLIATFFIIQAVWSIDLFKERISSIADAIIAILYVVLMLCGLLTFVGLIRRRIAS